MDAIFPTNISIWYKATKKARYKSMESESVSDVRRSFLFSQTPVWEIILPIGHLYQWEYELLQGFMNLLQGTHQTFYFLDPMNKQTDLLIGTGDGIETEFQLFRSWGYEELFKEYPQYPSDWHLGYGLDGYLTTLIKGFGVPVPPAPEVSVDGVLLDGDYLIDANGLITFTDPPAAGEAITATFYFCYKVALAEPMESSNIIYHGWATDLKLKTVK